MQVPFGGHLHLLQANRQEAPVLLCSSVSGESQVHISVLTAPLIFKTRHMDYCSLNNSYLHSKAFIIFSPSAINQQMNITFFHNKNAMCYLIKVYPF